MAEGSDIGLANQPRYQSEAPWHHKHKPAIGTVGALEGSGNPGPGDLPDYFLPLPTEELKTGALPTICSYEDMEMFKRQEALRAIADGQNPSTLPSPFANSGAQTEVHPLHVHIVLNELFRCHHNLIQD